MWLLWILTIAGGYLLGSVPSAYILVKLKKGIDIRKFGSGNVGSTNTMRAAGTATGLTVFLVDMLKGMLPAAAGLWLSGAELACCAGFAAFIGHLFPVWLQFKGGKGVATALGVGLVLVTKWALIGFAIWLIVTLLSGYVSLGSVSGVGFVPLACLFSGAYWLYTLVFFIVAAIVAIKHRGNFRNIRNGTESKSFRGIIRGIKN
ncbi:MAG: glycerol-3-phosphate 1-O-acyltransferase PlsY [Bacillota bacterium]|nr:glycerol-3-phosphate 1-O-acyltransferase PlsY [Bacillota bacterium]